MLYFCTDKICCTADKGRQIIKYLQVSFWRAIRNYIFCCLMWRTWVSEVMYYFLIACSWLDFCSASPKQACASKCWNCSSWMPFKLSAITYLKVTCSITNINLMRVSSNLWHLFPSLFCKLLPCIAKCLTKFSVKEIQKISIWYRIVF